MSSIPPPRMSAPVEGLTLPPKRRIPLGWLLVLGIVGTCGGLTIILSAILFPVFAQARNARQNAMCMANLRSVSVAMNLYCTENNDHYPPRGKWMDALATVGIRSRSERCPTVGNLFKNRYGFAMNRDAAGKTQSQVRFGTPLVFDSTMLDRNATTDLTSLPTSGRHRYRGKPVNHILLVGGSVINR